MQTVDLTRYTTDKTGTWFEEAENWKPHRLRLWRPDDSCTLAGPLRVRVSLQARNEFSVPGTGAVVPQWATAYSYVLDIPPGRLWTYRFPSHLIDLAGNAGWGVLIEPAGPDVCDPCVAPPTHEKDCHCGCTPCCCPTPDDVPCDFAVVSTNSGRFFPAACDPCVGDAPVCMPVMKGPSLIVPPAKGGVQRTRWFGGMYLAPEDFQTEDRYERMKRALTNRALGQGVVWGFNVIRDGGALVVCPGYGIDCCGNDLILTCPYRVEIASLLRDPAIAKLVHTRGPQRVDLLLEYYECPEQPRPVHGDPCSPAVTQCQPSRIRETVRLRLVPPCDDVDYGPIRRFLEATELDTKVEPPPGMKMGPGASTAPATLVPFSVTVESQSSSPGSATLQPLVAGDSEVNADFGDVPPATVSITLQKRLGFTWTKPPMLTFDAGGNNPGTLPQSTPIPPMTTAGDTVAWDHVLPPVMVPLTNPGAYAVAPPFYRYRFDWETEDASGARYSGITEVDLSPLSPTDWLATGYGKQHQPDAMNRRRMIQIAVTPTKVIVVNPDRPRLADCCYESCDPTGETPRFPFPPPWIHANPKVLVLAIAYGWILLVMQRYTSGASGSLPALPSIGANLFFGLRNVLFGPSATVDRDKLFPGLQKLFADWCQALLYPGPTCHCDPHGVVIGCAVIDECDIDFVDPWGGRRWVVLYPLLSYWGQQLGFMPLDVFASKLFSFICCLSNVQLPTRPVEKAPPPPVLDIHERALLALVPESSVASLMRERGLPLAGRREVNPVEFVDRVVRAMRQPAADAPLVHYTVTGLPDVHFVGPADEPLAGLGAAETPLAGMVAQAMRARPPHTAVPALLRPFAEDLATKLSAAVALRPQSPAEEQALAALAKVGARTVGAVLGRTAESWLPAVGRDNAATLDRIVGAAEAAVPQVADAVGDVVRRMSDTGTLKVRGDVRSEGPRSELTASLGGRIAARKLALTPADVAYAVEAVTKELV